MIKDLHLVETLIHNLGDYAYIKLINKEVSNYLHIAKTSLKEKNRVIEKGELSRV